MTRPILALALRAHRAHPKSLRAPVDHAASDIPIADVGMSGTLAEHFRHAYRSGAAPVARRLRTACSTMVWAPENRFVVVQ